MSEYVNVEVVGTSYRGADACALVNALEVPCSFRLEREPENPYDPNAIKVFYEDTHIGYVERGQAVWIAPDLDAGMTAECRVDTFIPTDGTKKKAVTPLVTITTHEPSAN